MVHKSKLVTFFLFIQSFLFSQDNKTWGSAEILHNLYKLDNVTNVLYIAAHPDDENTRLLAYLAGEKRFRTAYLSITRGDGGQNLIGKEQGEALGLIRTNELMAARKTDGAEQYFTRANDFGYSKNPDETFKFWNKDSILSDVVLLIRKFRPDIIICRFPTTGEGGHGHHTASAILALEAFEAAADPSEFSWQLKLFPVWRTKNIFWNTFNFGTTNTTSPDQIQEDVGAYNVLTGKSYGEVASESRSMHKSQGFGSPSQRGSNIEYFKFLKGDSVKKSLFENIDASLDGFLKTDQVKRCILNFDVLHPEKSIPALLELLKELNKHDRDLHHLLIEQKQSEIQNLILNCAGLWLEATASEPAAIPGNDIQLTIQALARNSEPVKLVRLTYPDGGDTSTLLGLKQNSVFTHKHRIKIASKMDYNNPYWLNSPHTPGLYSVPAASLIGTPVNESALKVNFELEINGTKLNIERDVVYKSTDPVKGEKYRNLEILPPVTIRLPEKVFVFNDHRPRTISAIIKANKAGVKGVMKIESVEGWQIKLKDPVFEIINKGDEVNVELTIAPLAHAPNAKLSFSAVIDDKIYNKSIQRIEYDHIPNQFILSDASAGLVFVDMKSSVTKIGYIPGAGDEVINCLKQVGYKVSIIDEEQLVSSSLAEYDAIVTGVRAYNTNERLQAHHNRLMNYVKNGGNLIVQYNTNSRVGPLQARIGPWPFNISRERVTDENSVVRLFDTKHAVLNKPNKITAEDFSGWVQERGIYFATETDKQYEFILSMHDPNEKEMLGSLITGKYGKGNFVYTGLAFFRQLPAGVPGAYRLFANLLSLPKN